MRRAIRGERRRPTKVEQGEGEQGLAVGFSGVLGDGEVGGVAEDLVQDVGGVAVGGDDDLGPVGRVLVGDVGVGVPPWSVKYRDRARPV